MIVGDQEHPSLGRWIGHWIVVSPAEHSGGPRCM
jgi:hypothetical protein